MPESGIGRFRTRARAQRHRRDERVLGAASFRASPAPRCCEPFRAVTDKRREVLAAHVRRGVERRGGRRRRAWTATAGSCGSGRSTAGCTSRTSARRWSGRRPTTNSAGRPRGCLDEIAATMGFVVGKLGKAPEGSRVQFELTGPLARSIRVGVDGRAQVVDDFGGRSRRRRSGWTRCSSPGWPAGGRCAPHAARTSNSAATRKWPAASSST